MPNYNWNAHFEHINENEWTAKTEDATEKTADNVNDNNSSDVDREQEILDSYQGKITDRWIEQVVFNSADWSEKLEDIIQQEIYQQLPQALQQAIDSGEVKPIHDQEAFRLFKQTGDNQGKSKEDCVLDRRYHYISSEWRMSDPKGNYLIDPHAYYLYENNWAKFIIEQQGKKTFLAWLAINTKKQIEENQETLQKLWINLRDWYTGIDKKAYKYWIPSYFNEEERRIIIDHQEEKKEEERKRRI